MCVIAAGSLSHCAGLSLWALRKGTHKLLEIQGHHGCCSYSCSTATVPERTDNLRTLISGCQPSPSTFEMLFPLKFLIHFNTEMTKKLLSNSCLVLPAVVKQQQEEISHNHVPSLFAVSVLREKKKCCLLRILKRTRNRD